MTMRNTIAMAYGRKGSGKSQLLWDLFTSKAPRKISLYSQPEDQQRFTGAIRVVGWAAFSRAIRIAAGHDRWHLDAVLEPRDVARLFSLLTPSFGEEGSLCEALGGVAIDCGELHMLAPNGRTAPEISEAIFRSRHYGLDMYLGTQRPASVSLDVRSQADEVFCFALESTRDMNAASEELRLDTVAPILALGRYQCLHRTRTDGRTVELDPARRQVRDLNPHAGS